MDQLAGTPLEAGYFSDTEAESCTLMSARSLRTLQAAGGIRADQQPKEHGGFVRVWPTTEVMRAALVYPLTKWLKYRLETAAGIVGVVPNYVFVPERQWTPEPKSIGEVFGPSDIVRIRHDDLVLEIVNERHVFLTSVHWNDAHKRYDTEHRKVGTLQVGGKVEAVYTPAEEDSEIIKRLYNVSCIADQDLYKRFEVKTQINIDLYIRAALRRAVGLPVKPMDESV